LQVADLKLRTTEKIAIAELRSCGCGATFFKVAELRLRKCFLQDAELRLRTQKKVARAHLCKLVTHPGMTGYESTDPLREQVCIADLPSARRIYSNTLVHVQM
jgi:hypothetical protein